MLLEAVPSQTHPLYTEQGLNFYFKQIWEAKLEPDVRKCTLLFQQLHEKALLSLIVKKRNFALVEARTLPHYLVRLHNKSE